MLDWLAGLWHLAGALVIGVAAVASGHAILYKRDARATVGWVGLIWLVPLVGALAYLLFGINRIKRRAARLRADRARFIAPASVAPSTPESLREALPADARHIAAVDRIVERVLEMPLLPGNRVEPLVDGDQAYPAMLDAIARADRTVALCTYIFDNDREGQRFVDALADAVARGVEVRVLVDDVGARYSFPAVTQPLEHRRVPTARFLRTLLPWRIPYVNLRSHRKVLVVDGCVGFTGGMNIREGNVLAANPPHPIRDLHFRVAGPVVAQLQQVFVEDWAFTTDETLQGDAWFPRIEPAGGVLARAIPDGPDEDLDKLRWTLLGAIASARSSVRIVTPYFLPDQPLITALNVAAMTGVRVDIVLPAENNIALVQWASTALLWQVLERGCRVWLSPPPFDHTKLMVVDGTWALIGSANWDPRSLRLNFELGVECYDRALAARLEALIERKLEDARAVTLAEVNGRRLPVKLRDGLARLASPYL